MKKQLVLIADSDPRTTIVGGVGTYTFQLAKQLHKMYEILYVGKKQEGKTSTSPYTVELITDKPGASNIKFYRNLFKRKNKLPIQKDAIIHAQRPDWIIPFRKHKGLKIITLHGSHYKNIKSKKGNIWATMYRYLEGKGIKYADKVIAVDHETQREYQEWYPKYAEKIVYYPVGVDTALFAHKQKASAKLNSKLHVDKKIFLFVGRLSKEKRVHEMIANLNDKEQLIIIGTGELRDELEALARDKDVIFLGSKKQKELVEYYNAANALLLFSTHEGLPTVVLEALACGLPVLSTPVGEVPNIIKNGKNGYVGTNFRLLMDKPLTREMKKKCVASAQKYDWKKVASSIEQEVYQ